MPGFLNIKEALKDIIIPPVCAVCGKLSESHICKSCFFKIRFSGDKICSRCGSLCCNISIQPAGIEVKPFLFNSIRENNPGHVLPCRQTAERKTPDNKFDKIIPEVKICSLCKTEDFYFYRARSFAAYSDELSGIIQKYKYKKYYYLDNILISCLLYAYYSYYNGEKIDFIETVPAYQEDRQYWQDHNTGYSHLKLIAQKLAAYLKIPFSDNIIKIKKTEKQSMLGRPQRKVNLAGAFKVKNCIMTYGKNFLVIDDVWTTGATLNEISFTLKNAGAGKIFLLTVARGIQ